MFLIRLLLLLSLFFTISFSKGEVSKIFAHKESAENTNYYANKHNHKWGSGKNIVIDGFEYNGHRYNYVSDAPIIKIRRADNSNASGEPCGLFAERKNSNKYKLNPEFPSTNGNCDMAKVMGGRVINVGALDLFRNVGYTAKNVERVDFISPQGIIAPSNKNNLLKAGHVVTEKSGNNYLQIAAILSIDSDNNPTSFGPLVMVHKHYDSSSKVRYGLTNIYFPNNSHIYKQNLGFYVDNTHNNQGKPWWIQNSYEPLGMAFVTLEDLGISAGQKYYGFSYFGRDVVKNSSNKYLVDYTKFPKDTGGDTADPYGGVASYFVDEKILYDFGDAPNSFPHVSHKISKKLYLGLTTPDNEEDQQSSSDASGDGDDDNDGVITLPTLTVGSHSYTVPVKVYNYTGQDAYITAWIDFNRNNKFEYEEALNVNDLTIHSSSSSQTINIVWDDSTDESVRNIQNATAGKAIMRIRLSTSRVLRCDSEHYSDGGSYEDNYFVSPDGEVEDYEITIKPLTPIVDYHFDECVWNGTVGEVIDSSGNYGNGTAKSGANTENSPILNRNGNFNRSAVVVPNNNSIKMNKDLTLATWVYVDNLNERGHKILFHKSSGAEFDLTLWNKQIRFYFDGDLYYDQNNAKLTESKKWYHIAVTRNLTTKKVKFYIDGQLVSTKNLKGDININVSTDDLSFGTKPDGVTNPLNGKMDEVKIFTNALDDKQIKQIYSNEKIGKNWDGTIRDAVSCGDKSVSGYIFNDKNHNGKKDNGEKGLKESSYIKLCKTDNTFIKSIKADRNTGAYRLDDIDSGDYKLIEDASDTHDCTTATDANGFVSTTTNILNITLNNSSLSNKNFGNYSGSTVKGYVYNDINKDGHKDSNEVGIANVHLEIRKCGDIPFAKTTTDANGSYTFWVPKEDDYDKRWVGIWETDLDGYSSTGDEFDNGNGDQSEKDEAKQDHNWLCFSKRVDVDFEKGGLRLVGNNFGDIKTPIADYGDAEDVYTHVSHKISDDLYLGERKPDAEADQQSSNDASGDGEDDNDGVINLIPLYIDSNIYTLPIKVYNNSGKDAYITAWIDFNNNGIFEYSEAVNSNNLVAHSKKTAQTINISWDNSFSPAMRQLIEGKATLRIRLSTSRVLRRDDVYYKNNQGYDEDYFVSPDGEVEDYKIEIKNKLTNSFECNNIGHIFTGRTTAYTNAYNINLENAAFNYVQRVGSDHINAIGYNVIDNFIYGVGYKSHHVLKIDKNYNIQEIPIEGLPKGKSFYAYGDVSFNNKYYISRVRDERGYYERLKKLYVINLSTQKLEKTIEIKYPAGMSHIYSADYAFNPVDRMLYLVDAGSNQLIRINPSTGAVTRLGDIGNIGDAYSVISFFDIDGNYFFSNGNNTAIYTIDISNPNDVDPTAKVYIDNLTLPSSGDGAKCAYSRVEPKKPVADYHFDECQWEGISGEVKDSSENQIHGTVKGDAKTVAEGKVGRAGYFDGDHDYIEIPNNPKLRLNSNSSFSLWIKPENLSKGRQGLLFKHYNNEFELIMERTGRISFYHGDGRWEEMREPNRAKVKENQWNHVVITRSVSTKTLTWYINGEKIGTYTYKKKPLASNTVLTIGIRNNHKNYGFKGFIDEVKLYNTTLSEAQISNIYINENLGLGWDGEKREIHCSIPGKPFSCSEESYLTTFASNKSNLYGLNLGTGESQLYAQKYTSDYINAIGYNVNDNYIWGWNLNKKKVMRLDANNVMTLYDTNVPILSQGYTSGDVSKDGILYIAKPSNDHKLHKLDLSSGAPVYIGDVMLSDKKVHFGDFAINPLDGYLYSTDSNRLYRVNLKNGQVEMLGVFRGPDSFYFHSYVFDNAGNMYFYSDQNSGKIFKLDLSDHDHPDLDAEVFATLEETTRNGDGARCVNAAVIKPLKLSIDDVTKPEGDSGTTDFTFTIELNQPAPKGGLKIEYATKDGTAHDEDFKGDDESGLPRVSISNASIKEGDSGTKKISFNVYLNKSAPQGGVTVQIKPHDKTAKEGEDYTRVTSSIYFATGELYKKVEYLINGDTKPEPSETFSVELFEPQNALLGNSTATGTIEDDDSQDSDKDDNDNDDNGNFWDFIKSWFSKPSGGSSSEKMQKSLPSDKSKLASTMHKMQKGDSDIQKKTKNSSSSTMDYYKQKDHVIITEGERNATITISVIGDNTKEPTETFFVGLLPINGVEIIQPIGTGTIINDDEENLSQKLSAEYRFDECVWNGTNGEVKDSSGNGFHGTAMTSQTGNVLPNTFSDEKIINRSAKFTQSKKQFVKVTNFNNFDHTKFSASMWIRVDENVNGWQTLLHKGASNNATNGVFRIKYNYNYGHDKLGLYTTFDNGSSASFYKTEVGLKDKQWHHLVVTYENREYKIYLDKSLVASKKYSKDLKAPNSELHIGGKYYMSNMYIDEVKLYNGVITADEIKEIYNNEHIGKNWDGTTREPVICQEPMEPFSCTDTLFLSNRSENGTSSSDGGSTWLHTINRQKEPYEYEAIGSGYTNKYNAMGYNIEDNFIYALDKNTLIKIDKNGVVKPLGIVSGLPETQLYAGEFGRDGYFYVSGNGGPSSIMYRIDIKQLKVVNQINLRYSMRGKNEPVMFWDMAVDSSGDYMYAMLVKHSGSSFKNDKIVKINITSSPASAGIMSVLGESHDTLPSYISLVFSGSNDTLYMMSNSDGYYKVDTSTGDMFKLGSTKALTFYNDGTGCPDANITEPPGIYINDVTKEEGDEGLTDFTFRVMVERGKNPMGMVAGMGFYFRIKDGTATLKDSDYKAEVKVNGGVFNINNIVPILPTTNELNITVQVVGDTKKEGDENFFVELYSPKFINITKSIGTGTIKDDDILRFNIERTNSDKVDNKTQAQKESLYTQIVDRDFDYTIVAYDKNDKPQSIQDMTLKVKLYDRNSSKSDNVLYEYYKYAKDKGSRFNVINSADLEIPIATRDAQFEVSYLVDENNSIIYGQYDNRVDYNTTKEHNATEFTFGSDDFAIRPKSYRIEIRDSDKFKSKLYKKNDNNSAINLASGYRYTLKAKAVGFKSEDVIEEYKTLSSKELNVTLIFDGTGTTHCADTNDSKITNYNFMNGELVNATLSHDNVGRYALHVEDINWTFVDQNKKQPKLAGCIPNSGEISANGDSKSGCNIVSNLNTKYRDIDIDFKAYEFNLTNIAIQNRPNNGQDYIYMSDLNKTLRMGIEITSDIIAQGMLGTQLTNYTDGCFAEDISIVLDYNITSDQVQNAKTYRDLNTTRGSGLNFKRVVSYNGNALDINQVTVAHLDTPIVVSKEKFLSSNEGNSSIDVLYNIEKSLSEPTNPIRLTYNEFNASSPNSKAKCQGEEKIPSKADNSGLINDTKRFYFSKIASDMENYPTTYDNHCSTPLTVSIFCDLNRTWCQEMIGGNGLNSQITQEGWYTARFHNSDTDGGVIGFISQKATVTPTVGALPNFNQSMGRIDTIETSYNGSASKITTTVTVDVDEWLKYHEDPARNGIPFWQNTFSKSPATISGVGKTGKIIQLKSNTTPTQKIDW
jgi:hypothetical protein